MIRGDLQNYNDKVLPDDDEILRIESAFDHEDDTERYGCECCGVHGLFPYTPNLGFLCPDCLSGESDDGPFSDDAFPPGQW